MSKVKTQHISLSLMPLGFVVETWIMDTEPKKITRKVIERVKYHITLEGLEKMVTLGLLKKTKR